MFYTEYEKPETRRDTKKIDERPLSPKEKPLEKESLDDIQKEIALMIKSLDDIYKNKSSDEYKMAGDITKSSVYDKLETAIADLKTLKGFPKMEADDYQRMFDNLHKPLYKNMVVEFLKKPNEKNTTFTALFTCGYRVLIGDMSVIFASTEATENGIIYKPELVKNKNLRSRAFVHDFCKNLDEEYNKALRRSNNRPKMHQEYALMNAFGGAVTALSTFIQAHELIPVTAFMRDIFGHIFGAARVLNPISYINNHLTRKFDDEVKSFEDIQKLYTATKEAYDEYLSKPGRHNPAVEARYKSNLVKYKIQMSTATAKLDHYDSRAIAKRKEEKDRLRLEKREQRKAERLARKEVKKNGKKVKGEAVDKPTMNQPAPSHPSPSAPEEEKPKPTPTDTGDFDF